MIYYQMFKKLYSNYYFQFDNLNKRIEIEQQFNKEEWQQVIKYFYDINFSLKRKFLITNNSYQLVNKIKNQIGINLFPIIELTYINSNYKSQGYSVFKIYDKDLNVYGSCYNIKDLLKKSSKLKILELNNELFIEL